MKFECSLICDEQPYDAHPNSARLRGEDLRPSERSMVDSEQIFGLRYSLKYPEISYLF